MEAIDKVLNVLKGTSVHPLAVPVVVGILTVFVTVLVFFRISSSVPPKNKKPTKAKSGNAPSMGTTTVNGVRRTTRWVVRP